MDTGTQGWLAGLNPRQREAATCGDGPLLIVAGAHSYAQCCRFLTGEVTATMECVTPAATEKPADVPSAEGTHRKILERINDMWR